MTLIVLNTCPHKLDTHCFGLAHRCVNSVRNRDVCHKEWFSWFCVMYVLGRFYLRKSIEKRVRSCSVSHQGAAAGWSNKYDTTLVLLCSIGNFEDMLVLKNVLSDFVKNKNHKKNKNVSSYEP